MRFLARFILTFILLMSICSINAQEASNNKLTNTISLEFDRFTKSLGSFLSYEIPLYTGSLEITENKVINFEDLAQKIKLQDEKIYKYLNDKFLEDNFSKELLDSYQYEIEPSEKLINLVAQKFHVSVEDLRQNQFYFIKYLAKPLPLEHANFDLNLMPNNLKEEIKNFKGVMSNALEKYILQRFHSSIYPDQKSQFLIVIDLYYKIILLENKNALDAELKLALSQYVPIQTTKKELRATLVAILNKAIHDENFNYHFPELNKGKDLRFSPEDIRNFLVAEKIVLPNKKGIPLIVLVLALGSVIFTILYKFINIKGLYHSIAIVRGKYNNPDDRGEISHFQSLTFALSATVGLGNIAGIALAVCMGGPGIVFWMWVTALFGMATKFNSCLFSQVYREIDPKTGKVKGGPMYYLSKGISDLYPSFSWLGKLFAIIFCFFCILGSFGGGNLFQVNQAYESVSSTFHLEGDNWKWVIGFTLASGVAIATIGGAKKMGAFAAKLVPCMCVFYICTCLIIILKNAHMVPSVLHDIFTSAFNFKTAAWGGLMSIFLNGVKRATFSNEAGLGSSAIIHATTKTDEPVREGLVAMMEPFIDTIIICTITAITILVTNAHLSGVGEGIKIIGVAFASVHPVFLFLLSFAVLLFAFSTLITWCYCGERSAEYLFGTKAILFYRISFVACIIFGPIVNLTSIIAFSDMMMLCMAFPNIIGGILLFKKGGILFNDYWKRYQAGEIVSNQKI